MLPKRMSLVTFQHKHTLWARNLTFKDQIAISCFTTQDQNLIRYLEQKTLKSSYNKTQTTMIETLN
jgi:hypothetical protein